MTLFELSAEFPAATLVRDGRFRQTQFAGTAVPDSVCYALSETYVQQANENPAISCVVTSAELAPSVSVRKGAVAVEAPEMAFYQLHNRLFLERRMSPEIDNGKHPTARIHPTAIVAEHCRIGADVEIGPGAIIEPYSRLDDGVCVGPGAIVGAAGHYFKRFGGRLFRVEHAGGVWLRAGSQILAGAVVSRALHTDFTIVGEQSVVSIKAHVGHGCRIGMRCILAGNAQIAGYTELGDDVWVGPSATVRNLARIGHRARIEIGSVVVGDVADDEVVSGNFAYSHQRHVRHHVRKVSS